MACSQLRALEFAELWEFGSRDGSPGGAVGFWAQAAWGFGGVSLRVYGFRALGFRGFGFRALGF